MGRSRSDLAYNAKMKKKLKIALTCDWFLPQIGGIELHLRDLAHHFIKEGHQAHIITPFPGPRYHEGIPIHRICSPRIPKIKIRLNPLMLRSLERVLKKGKFDILHAHSGVVSPFAYGSLYIAQKLKIPHVITNHSLLENSAKVFRWLNLLSRWHRWPVELSSVSSIAAEGMYKASGGKKDVKILHNGINPEEWQLTPLPHSEIRITSVMRITRKKRPLSFIKSIPKILSKIKTSKPVKFCLIGSGSQIKKVKQEICKLGIGKYVELQGYLSRAEIKKVFQKTDLFASPTLKESFGIAVLEARCAGLPIVAMNYGGVRDFIQSGKEGFLAKNDREYIDYIVELIHNEKLRKKMSERARENTDEFSWKKIIQNHLTVYQKAMENMNAHKQKDRRVA